MNDKELLEMAAKAAGHKWTALDAKCLKHGDIAPIHWNPLTDDGDALRLAVKLDLLNKRNIGYPWPMDINGARRAIVRAAAEIGKAMP